MDEGNFPGRSDLNIQAVADRLAVINLISAYAHYAQQGDLASWSKLFYPDAIFTTTAPGVMANEMPMAKVIEIETPLFDVYAKISADPTLGEQKIYRFGHPLFHEQTSDFISFTSYVSQVRMPLEGANPRIHFAATYEGECRKTGVDWKISRWTIKAAQRPDLSVPSPWWKPSPSSSE